MPAVVMRSVCQKTPEYPLAPPRYEWLTGHDLAPVKIAAAAALLREPVPLPVLGDDELPAPQSGDRQPKPEKDAGATWSVDSREALVFSSYEMADAVSRLLRPLQGEQTKVYPAIREKPMPARQVQVEKRGGEISVTFERPPARRIGRQYRRAHLPQGEDWHQRAVNSGGND